MISNSGSDEKGAYANGLAGDQTKKEWQIRSWYNRPWTVVLRYPNRKVGVLLSNLSIKAAKNDKIGYDQMQRESYWKELQKVKYDPSKIKTKCEADCSSGVIANTKAVGHILGIVELQQIHATYTGNMRTSYQNAGFKVLIERKYLQSEEYLEEGDVLLNDRHHVAVYVGEGKIIPLGAKTETKKKTTKKKPCATSHKAKNSAQSFNEKLAGTYTTTANLNMRHGAGTNKQIMITLPKNTKVKNYGYYTNVLGTKWLYVSADIGGKEFVGFCSKSYLKK